MSAERKHIYRPVIPRASKYEFIFETQADELQHLNDRIEDILVEAKLPMTRISKILNLGGDDDEPLAVLKTQVRDAFDEASDHLEICDLTAPYLAKLLSEVTKHVDAIEKTKIAIGWKDLLDCLWRFLEVPAAVAAERVENRGQADVDEQTGGEERQDIGEQADAKEQADAEVDIERHVNVEGRSDAQWQPSPQEQLDAALHTNTRTKSSVMEETVTKAEGNLTSHAPKRTIAYMPSHSESECIDNSRPPSLNSTVAVATTHQISTRLLADNELQELRKGLRLGPGDVFVHEPASTHNVASGNVQPQMEASNYPIS